MLPFRSCRWRQRQRRSRSRSHGGLIDAQSVCATRFALAACNAHAQHSHFAFRWGSRHQFATVVVAVVVVASHISVRHLQLIAHFICAFICIFSHTAAVLAAFPTCPPSPSSLWGMQHLQQLVCVCCCCLALQFNCPDRAFLCSLFALPSLCLSLSPSLSLSLCFGFSCLPLGLIVHLVCIFMKSLCGLCNKFNSGLFMCHPRDIYHSI